MNFEQVLMRRSCEDPVDILEESLHDLAQVRVVEILVKSSLRGPSMILYRSLSEVLVEIMARSFL